MRTPRALIAAGSTAVLLSAVALQFGDSLPLSFDAQPASFVTAQEPGEDKAAEDPARDDGIRTSATRPRSGTGGPVTLLELPVPQLADEPAGDDEPDEEDDKPVAEPPSEEPPARSGGLLAAIGEILWNGDVETGDFSQFDDTPWNQVGSPDPEIVRDPVRDGEYAIGYTIPGGGNRNESVPDMDDITEGDDLYFGFSTMLGEGFPVDESWQVITQWKNDGTGSPPLSLNVEKGNYLIHGGYGHPNGSNEFREQIGPASTGEWVDWVFHVTFSSESDEGQVTVWQNGRKVIDGFSPDSGTLYPGRDTYVKIGYYRNTDIDQDGTVYFDNWRVGRSLN